MQVEEPPGKLPLDKIEKKGEGNTITGLRRIACEGVSAIKEHVWIQNVFCE